MNRKSPSNTLVKSTRARTTRSPASTPCTAHLYVSISHIQQCFSLLLCSDQVLVLQQGQLSSCTFLILVRIEGDVSKLESKNGCVKTINVHFVRHGEGEHNVLAKQLGYAAYRDPKVMDAKLTPLGEQQATTLQQVFTSLEQQALDLIAVSPLRRTLQTATLATQLVSEKVPRVAFETLREQIGQNICDKRRSVSVASAEFPLVDFANVVEHDPLWTETREDKSAMAERAYAFVESLMSHEGVNDVAVFTHSSYLFTMFNAAGVLKICEKKNPHNTALKTWFATENDCAKEASGTRH